MAVLVVSAGPIAGADQLVFTGKSYIRAKLINFADGQLYFRTADGQTLSRWIDELDMLIVDRGRSFADFNDAEQFLFDNDPPKAIVRYRRALRSAKSFWSDLIASRLLVAYNRAGRLDDATRTFVRVLRGAASGPAAAARLMPKRLPIRSNSKMSKALEPLDAALMEESNADRRTLLWLLRFELLRSAQDNRADEAAQRVASAVIPASARTERIFTIVHHALARSLATVTSDENITALDRAIRDCPQGSLIEFLLLKGKTLLNNAKSREELIRASWPFLRVVVHMPDDARAADGLIGAAKALERIGKREQAVEMLTMCAQLERATDDTRRAAQETIGRLVAEGNRKP